MLSLSDIVNVKVGIGKGVFEAPGATVIGGKKPSINLEILKLFANGEQGFWYDPDDLSTMYQDAAGTDPVTAVGRPVGLILDKSKGAQAGVELATVSSVVTDPIDSNTNLVKQYKIADVVYGKTYKISFKVSNFNGALDVGVTGPLTNWADNRAVNTTSDGVITCIRTFIGAGSILTLYSRSSNQCKFSEISVREVPGNHAYQTTSASRPILRKNAVTGANYLEFDGADDHLIIGSLPSILAISIACAVRARQSKTSPVLGRGVGAYLYASGTSHIIQGAASAAMTAPYMAEAVIATSARVGDVLKTKVRNKTNINLLDREGAGSGGYANTNNIAIGAFTATGNTPGAIDLYGIIAVNKIISESDEDTLLAHYNKLAGA